ncbi:hypothetical protein ERHA55_53470 (plasmid) [Erwinia rhapontici]|nr:hypothetical protein ERHA55_53470 [Erwinia rhapontici]
MSEMGCTSMNLPSVRIMPSVSTVQLRFFSPKVTGTVHGRSG